MKVERLALPEVMLIVPTRHGDARGDLAETFHAGRYAALGITLPFLQDNQTRSHRKGTLRGLHCQIPPHAQGKLVRVLKGAAWDVAVDIRAGSPSFGRWVGATLTAEGGEQLWVPPGFLHGFVTLTDDAEILYKMTDLYDRAAERGVIWSDRALGIAWPVAGAPILSEKDGALPSLEAARGWFPA